MKRVAIVFHIDAIRTAELLECLAKEGPPFIFAHDSDSLELNVGDYFTLGDQHFRIKRMTTEAEWRASSLRNRTIPFENPIFFEAETD